MQFQVWIDNDLDVDHLTISNLYRKEHLGDIEMIKVRERANIGTLSLSNVLYQNETGTPKPLLLNEGSIGKLYMFNVDAGSDEKLVNTGSIGKIVEL